MQQTIKPLGIATNPSDYDCADGELAASFNIINEDGSLRPLPQPVAANITLQDSDTIRCIHATSTFKHYIATNGSTLAWYDNGGNRQSITLPATIHKVTPIGNTLAVLTGSGLCYLLWKYDDNNNATYTNLGSKPPFLELQFGVSANNYAAVEPIDGITYSSGYGWFAKSMQFDVSDIRDDTYIDTIKPEYRKDVTELVWSLINPVNAKITETNHFYAPFFVRYCYRLYDGSTYMHSAPVLIPLCSPRTFHLAADLSLQDNVCGFSVKYKPVAVALLYKCISQVALNDWRDIIQSVDVFVSLPIIREDNAKNISLIHVRPPQFKYIDNKMVEALFPNSFNHYTEIPLLYNEDEFLDKIKSTSDFYKIASLEIENTLPATFTALPIRTGVLSTLATQEAMTDDYHSHNDVLPTIEDNRCITSLFNYNNRLSIAAPTERLFKGFSLETMLPYETATAQREYICAIVIHLRTEQGIKRVVYNYGNTSTSVSKLLLSSLPLFYPDNRASRMDIYYTNRQGDTLSVIPLPMKQHPLLNGATTTNAYLITSLTDNLPTGQAVSDNIIPFATDTLTTLNQIRTSEVDNPFYYPAINYKRVGVGTILALSTSAKALSQGQFGQHPLYAFCTDGVWALGVDTTDGTFVPAQPFTRDVCSNPDSILQLDSTVLFPTDRGIMLVNGSQTQCITEKLDYPHTDLSLLPRLEEVLNETPIFAELSPVSMREYIKHCKMIYDYRNQHVIVFNPALSYAYVYSIKSGLWAMMSADFAETLNAYPSAMAVTESGQLVQFPDPSDPSDNSAPSDYPSTQFLVTRPFKLGSNEHKTITALVLHGMIEDRQHVRFILYGSRDLATWHVVGSSTTNTLRGLSGTPYTAFRLAVIADLTATESLSDFSVEFTPKHTRVLK